MSFLCFLRVLKVNGIFGFVAKSFRKENTMKDSVSLVITKARGRSCDLVKDNTFVLLLS